MAVLENFPSQPYCVVSAMGSIHERFHDSPTPDGAVEDSQDYVARSCPIEANLKALQPGQAVQELVDGQGQPLGLSKSLLSSLVVTKLTSTDAELCLVLPADEFAHCRVAELDIMTGLDGRNIDALAKALAALRCQSLEDVYVEGTGTSLVAFTRILASLMTITLQKCKIAWKFLEPDAEFPSAQRLSDRSSDLPSTSSICDASMSSSATAFASSSPAHGVRSARHHKVLCVKDLSISFRGHLNGEHPEGLLSLVDLLAHLCPHALDTFAIGHSHAWTQQVHVQVDPLFFSHVAASLTLGVPLVPSAESVSSSRRALSAASLTSQCDAPSSSNSPLITIPASVSSSAACFQPGTRTSSFPHAPPPTKQSIFSHSKLITAVRFRTSPSLADCQVIAGLSHLRGLHIECYESFSPEHLAALAGTRIETLRLDMNPTESKSVTTFTDHTDLHGLAGLTRLTDLELRCRLSVLRGWRVPDAMPLKELRLKINIPLESTDEILPSPFHFPANSHLLSVTIELSNRWGIGCLEELILPSLACLQQPLKTLVISYSTSHWGPQASQPPPIVTGLRKRLSSVIGSGRRLRRCTCHVPRHIITIFGIAPLDGWTWISGTSSPR